MRFLKIYLASSWRNKYFENLLNALRIQGYYTYDFKHPEAVKAFEKDFHAMQEADYCVLLLPCGRSAHSEAGWMKGQGKKVFVLDMSEKPTPELMYQMFDAYVTRPIDLVEHIEAAFHKDNMLLKENFSTHG